MSVWATVSGILILNCFLWCPERNKLQEIPFILTWIGCVCRHPSWMMTSGFHHCEIIIHCLCKNTFSVIHPHLSSTPIASVFYLFAELTIFFLFSVSLPFDSLALCMLCWLTLQPSSSRFSLVKFAVGLFGGILNVRYCLYFRFSTCFSCYSSKLYGKILYIVF